MPGLKYRAIGTAFELLSATGAAGLVRRFSGCLGVIFTLHRVLADPPAEFSPNAILQVTPEFLDAVILRARELDIDGRGGDAHRSRPFGQAVRRLHLR